MTQVDLSRLPTGEMGWLRLINYVLESDDRVERYFLEVKSEVDLSSKRDQAKIAKYILGAANRDPRQAQRRFDGHARSPPAPARGASSYGGPAEGGPTS